MDEFTALRRDLGLLTEGDVAGLLGKTQRALRDMRTARIGPPWIKVGRAVFYRQAALDQWLEAQQVDTSRPSPQRANAYTF